MDRTKILVDVVSRKFSFGFAPGCSGAFSEWKVIGEGEPILQNFCEEALYIARVSDVRHSAVIMALNTAVHESKECTLDRLFWGKDLKCPLGV